jgi:hypothetical protein
MLFTLDLKQPVSAQGALICGRVKLQDDTLRIYASDILLGYDIELWTLHYKERQLYLKKIVDRFTDNEENYPKLTVELKIHDSGYRNLPLLLFSSELSVNRINRYENCFESSSFHNSSQHEFRRAPHVAFKMGYDEIKSLADSLVKKNMIKGTKDPESNIVIYNYTKLTGQNRDLRIFRGLMLDNDCKSIVSYPFVRFGINDSIPAEQKLTKTEMDNEICSATLKLDGSLIIVINFNGKLKVATRSKFDSEQAIWANQWIINNRLAHFFIQGFTYQFELIGGLI